MSQCIRLVSHISVARKGLSTGHEETTDGNSGTIRVRCNVTFPVPDFLWAGFVCMITFSKWILRKVPRIAIKHPIELQIQAYTLWKDELFPSCGSHEKPQLESLVRFTGITDICELTKGQVFEWAKSIYPRHSYYYFSDCLKTARCLLRYHRARGYDCLSPYELPDREVK